MRTFLTYPCETLRVDGTAVRLYGPWTHWRAEPHCALAKEGEAARENVVTSAGVPNQIICHLRSVIICARALVT